MRLSTDYEEAGTERAICSGLSTGLTKRAECQHVDIRYCFVNCKAQAKLLKL